jgi:glucose dehydrogenase
MAVKLPSIGAPMACIGGILIAYQELDRYLGVLQAIIAV